MNYVNYLIHTLYAPDICNRRIDLDLPNEDTGLDRENQAKRVGLLVLPFISLYRPAGHLLAIGMGGARVITHLSGAISAKDRKHLSIEMGQIALAVVSIAGTVFNFWIGIAITNSLDTLQGAINSYQALTEKEYKKATEEILQTLASAAYLTFMVYGALEALVLFAILQAAVSFLQAHKDLEKGRYPEAAAKCAMGLIRLDQARGYMQQVQYRNRLLAVQKYADFLRCALKGREVRHLIENPLAEFKEKEEQLNLGAYFHGHGKGLVKGMNLAFRTQVIDGKKMIELDFKVNHVFRETIQKTIDSFTTLDSQEMAELLRISQSHARGFRIEKNARLPLGMGSKGSATQITLEGLGSLFIGSTPDLPTMYDRVVVRMSADKNIYDLHELMAFLDVDQALQISAEQDIDRLKIGHLFRIFFPREATPFERTEEFFSLSVDQLKEKIIEKVPEMQTIFQDYLTRITPQEILPGKMRYRIEGLAQIAHELGARGLTAAVTAASTDQELYERVGSILKMGLFSSELRAQASMNIDGISTNADFGTGGADSVFVQMITEKNCQDEMDFAALNYNNKIRFLISLDALEMGTYQYFYDSFGTRRFRTSQWDNSYSSRPGILEFIDGLQHAPKSSVEGWSPYGSHEVMLKERIAPSFLTGIAVSNAQTRDGLMEYLRAQGLVQLDGLGQETILGIAAEQFVRVAKRASEVFPS